MGNGWIAQGSVIVTDRAASARALLEAGTLLLIGVVYLWFALLVRGAHDFSGDEPHYLAITQGLWLYHTIDQHRVLYHHDFLAYFPQGMSSHSVHRGAHLYPLHYPGLSLVLLAGFAMGGAAGAQVITAAIALLVCWRTFRLAERAVGAGAAAVAVGVLGLSAPFVLDAGAIYPDLLSALLLILAFEALDAPRLTARRALALGLVLAACPWVHVKLLAAAGMYMLWAAYALWSDARSSTPPPLDQPDTRRGAALERHPTAAHRDLGRRALLALGLPCLSVAALTAYNLALYGSPSPTAPYQGPILMTGNPLGGIIGQVFAQSQGALGTAPFALLAIPGAVALWRRDRPMALRILLVTAPFWLATLTYRDWWGGDAPPLRYLLTLLPLWTPGIAVLLASLRTVAARAAVAILAAITLALTLVVPVAARFGWPVGGGKSALLLAIGDRVHLPLAEWLPAFHPTRYGPGVWYHSPLIAVWAVLLLLLWAALAHREHRAGAVPV